MTTRIGRDKGLATVRKTTIWIAGGAIVAVGAFAALFGQPQAGAKTNTSAADSTEASPTTTGPSTTTTTRPRSGTATSPTTPRTTPTTQAPRPSRRRPSVSSGGS